MRIMGMEAPSGEKMVAHVLCNGGTNAVKNFEYRGVQDCLAATKVCGGDALACKYGCLGFGSCVAACKFDALHIGPNGAAVVDKEKCTNCGACREACPRKLIVEVPYSKKVFVNCSNKDKEVPPSPRSAPTLHRLCGMCQRTCKFDAIHVVNNVAVVGYTKCEAAPACQGLPTATPLSPSHSGGERRSSGCARRPLPRKKAAAAKLLTLKRLPPRRPLL